MFNSYDIYDRERMTLHLVINLLSPLSHIGEVSGNVSNLKTLKILDIEGNPRSCFVYSGNALRNGILRRRGVSAALEELNLTIDPDVHHTMFAGGRIDGSTASDMELDKKIRQVMPWLSVLGTAKPVKVFGTKDAQMVQGRINVGSAYLMCYESAGYIFEQFPGILPSDSLEGIKAILMAAREIVSNPFVIPSQEKIEAFSLTKKQYLPVLRKILRSWTEYLVIDQTTRRDSNQDAGLRKFLKGSQAKQGQLSLFTNETEKTEKKKSDQMIASDRLIMAGAKLYSRWDLHTTKVETGWIVDTLMKFSESPYLGGKGNRGNGLCSMELWFQNTKEQGHFLSIATGQNVLSPQATEAHNNYQDYLQEYRNFLAEAKESSEIRRLLDGTP